MLFRSALPTEGVLSGLFGTQGLRSRRSASALTLAGLPLPSVVESVVEVASAGKDTNTTTTTTSTTAEAKPPTTSVDLEQTLPATTLSLGGSQRLAEAVNLAYEVVNLQTLLERSLSDAFTLGPSSKARKQVLLGFSVSLVPPTGSQSAIAEVEVKITGTGGPQVTMVLPQEKTYNVATITSNSNLASLGLISTLIGVGASGGQASENHYLVQDTDTASFVQHYTSDTGLQFGWHFRPVLGQPTVTPGMRNVLVGLSVERDTTSLKIERTVRWRKYDAKRRTVGAALGTSERMCLEIGRAHV